MRRDDEALGGFSGILVIIGVGLIIIGLLLIASGSWSIGFGCIGVGCILSGLGGPGSIETPWGTVTAGAGVILLILAFAINQIFHR